MEYTPSSEEGADEGVSRVSGLVCQLDHFPVRSQSADRAGEKMKQSRNPVALGNSPFLPLSLFILEQIWQNQEGGIFQMSFKKKKK